MSPDEAEVVERWRRGEAGAFEALVRRWHGDVARLLGRLGGPADGVPDLCQEVFLRVHRARPRYREAGTFSAWLYRIAVNVARDAHRRRRHDFVSLNGHQPEDARTGDAACQQQEDVRAVAGAVADLPGPLREVLVLRHYEAMSFEEIARVTGTPTSTLKSRFAAALYRLREALKENAP